MHDTRYTFGHQGQSHFLRPALDIQAAVVEPFFASEGWQYDRDYFARIPALYQSSQPTALGGMEVAGVVMCFIASCFAKKIFDEVYERTLKRPIGAQLDKLLNTIEIPEGKTVEYRDIIYLEDIDLVVVIRAMANKDCGVTVQEQVMQAHRVAHAYIEQHGREAPIHCHTIVEGSVTIKPKLFSTLDEIMQHDRAKTKIIRR